MTIHSNEPFDSRKGVGAIRVARFLWSYWRRFPLVGLVTLGLMLASIVFDVLFPIVSGRLVEAVSSAGYPPALSEARAAWIALALFVGQAVGFQISRRSSMIGWGMLATRVMRSIVNEAFHRVQRYSTDWHSSNFAGATVRKITRGMWAYDALADTLFMGFLPTSLVMVGVTASLMFHWPLVGLYVLAGAVAYVVVTILLLRRFVAPRNRLSVAADSAVGGAIADAITCNTVVKSFGTETREDGRLATLSHDWSLKAMYAWRAMDFVMMAQVGVLILLQLGLLGLVIRYWIEGRATPGDVAYAMTSYLLISGYMRDVGFHVQNLQRAANEIEDVIRFAENEPAEPAGPHAAPLDMRGGDIRFEDVSFAYPSGKGAVYRGLDAHVKPGEKVALVGRSGSGKTTFVKLLQRLYDIDGGRILIDGQDIAGVTRESLRQSIALVPQEPMLFHRSLAENIAYARPGASAAEIEEAARLANAHEFIGKMPLGYGTLVGERGVKLSGGERQRIAIARAFLADAPILVLDEATSSLDSETEELIQDAMDRLMEGRTTIVVAHRFSTIRRMDRILVFDEGQIVEEGAHAELMARKGGRFRTLHAVQLAGIRDAVPESAQSA